MAEWSGYGLSDFLMFSPQAYWRLVERHNTAWWPAPVLAMLAAATLPWLTRSPRGLLVVLALAWAWVGWAFHWRRYAEIFLAAPWLAAACWLQAAALLAAIAGVRAAPHEPSRWGVAPLVAALLYPLLAPLTGHPWRQAEVFGFMPEPTALATLGSLLLMPQLARWLRVLLAVVPTAALLLGAATRWLLAS